MLSKPILALTADRTRRAQTNDYCGDPEDWFDSQPFREHNLYATSFDFFVNWEQQTICDEVWIKRISDTDQIQTQTKNELMELVATCDGAQKANQLYRFLRYQRMIEKYMLFRNVPEQQWENGEEHVVELDMSQYQSDEAVGYFDAAEIQMKIRDLRRTAAPIGQAGLIYSTSTLEGYLSRQPYFWPGDADTVLFDENNQVVAIIEFKKHTANSRIPFQNQRIDNYLNRDILKYKSLAILRDRFDTDLFVLYYPIPRDIDYVIVEKIEGPPNNLQATARYELDLPDRRRIDRLRAFADSFTTQVLNR